MFIFSCLVFSALISEGLLPPFSDTPAIIFFSPNVMFLLLSVFSSLHLLKYLKHTYFYVPLKLSHFLYFPACNASLSLLLFLTRGLSPSCPQGKGTKPGQTLSAQRSWGRCVLTPLTRSGTVDSPVLLLALDIHAHPCLCACVCPHSSCSSALGEGTARDQLSLLS